MGWGMGSVSCRFTSAAPAATECDLNRVGYPASRIPTGNSRQSATTLQVQLRGPAWLFESVSLSRLAVRFDLRGLREGAQNVTWQAGALNLPPGIQVERGYPASISVVLAPKGPCRRLARYFTPETRAPRGNT